MSPTLFFSGLRKRLTKAATACEPKTGKSVADEQLCIVASHVPVPVLLGAAFASILALQLGDLVATPSAVNTWLAIKILVAGLRILQAVAYRLQGAPNDFSWRCGCYSLLALDAAVWGIGAFMMMSAPHPEAFLIGAAAASISCVATFGLQVSLRATALFVTPILIPSTIGLLLRDNPLERLGGVGLLMLVALQLITAIRSEKRLKVSHGVRLRALEITHEKDQALKLALMQSSVKAQFLVNISHELRTPLHGILGVARLMHLEAGDKTMQHRAKLIETSGTHLLSLINDLLDISRVEAGRFAMRVESFDLVTQIRQIADVYAVRAQDRGLVFTHEIALEDPCWVLGDPARFRQVLHNLLGNAIKFTQNGSISLSVERRESDDMIHTEVRDSGTGLAEHDLAHIFEAFHQVDVASTPPLEGAGLGLTIAREIAKYMGGDITVQSAIGIGSCFEFTACLPPSFPIEKRVATRPDTAAGAIIVVPHSRHVLVAEDDEVNALVVMAYLKHFGMVAERVANGKDAVRHALREVSRPDIVLMDCYMPGMDGYAATREIRAQEQALGLPRVPVVALTATATDIDRKVCLEAGMDDFLSKPFTQEELARMITLWTNPSSVLEAGQAPSSFITEAW